MKGHTGKISVWLEEPHFETGRPIEPPTRDAVAPTVIESPFTAKFAEDLSDLMGIGTVLGGLLGDLVVDAPGITANSNGFESSVQTGADCSACGEVDVRLETRALA